MKNLGSIACAGIFALLAGCSAPQAGSQAADPPEDVRQVEALRQQMQALADSLSTETLPSDLMELVQQAKAARYKHARGYELHIALLQLIAGR